MRKQRVLTCTNQLLRSKHTFQRQVSVPQENTHERDDEEEDACFFFFPVEGGNARIFIKCRTDEEEELALTCSQVP